MKHLNLKIKNCGECPYWKDDCFRWCSYNLNVDVRKVECVDPDTIPDFCPLPDVEEE